MLKHLVIAASVLPFLGAAAFAGDDDFVISNNPDTRRIMGFQQQPVQEETAAQENEGGQVEELPAQAAYDHHPVPATPPGWDSLTTGEANGGGVLNSLGNNNMYGNASVGFLPPGMATIPGQPLPTQYQVPLTFANGGMQQPPIMPMTNAINSSALGIAQTGGVMTTGHEQAMYGNALLSLLQYALSQPGQVQGYGGMPAYGYGQAYTGGSGYVARPPASNVRIRPRTSAFVEGKK